MSKVPLWILFDLDGIVYIEAVLQLQCNASIALLVRYLRTARLQLSPVLNLLFEYS